MYASVNRNDRLLSCIRVLNMSKQIAEFPDAGAVGPEDYYLVQQGPVDTPLTRITHEDMTFPLVRKDTLGKASGTATLGTDARLTTSQVPTALTTDTLNVTGATTLASLSATTGAFSGNVAVATNKFTVASASGNTVVAGTLGVTGTLTASGAFVSTTTATARLLNVVAQVSLPGNYTAAASPFNMSMSIIRTTDPVSTASRDLMRTTIASDLHDTGGPTLTMKSEIWQLGVVGAAVADSWGGSRVMRRFFITDSNQPASALVAPTGAVSPTNPQWNCTWSGITTQNTRGGLAPEQGWAVGVNFLDYGSIIHKSPTATATGAINLNNSHLYEGGLFFFPKTSAQSAAGFGLNVALNQGVSPVYAFDAYSFGKRGRSSLGFRLGFGTSGFSNFHGLDPLRGTFAGIKASQNDPVPVLLNGFDVRDVAFGGSALTWAGGKINGGTHGTVGTGSLDIGTARLSNTTAGASLGVSGYIGRAVGYVFTAGSDLIENDPIIAVRTSMIGDDAYGGVYRFYGADAGTNTFARAVVLTSPIYKGVTPPATVEIELRDTSGGVTEWEITETGTTTVHPTQLTTTIDDFYVDRILRYVTGPAAGEEQVITGYDASSGELTTAAFSTNPTANISLVVNYNFASTFPTAENTILNGWQYTLNGGTGTATKLDVPTVEYRHIQLVGDGTNAASIDQEVAFSGADTGIVSVMAFGDFRIKIGSTRGGSDFLDATIVGPTYPHDEAAPSYVTTRLFYATGTAVWIRVENASTVAAGVRIVRVAQGDEIVPAVRASILTKRLEVTQSWTERKTLDLQPDGGPATVGGVLDVVDDFSVATNKFTVDAATGAIVAASTATAGAFVPSSATTPTIGMYLPGTANTLGFAISSTPELYLDASALHPVTNDGLALGKTTNGFSDAFFAFGAVLNFDNSDIVVTHASNRLAFDGGRFLFGGTTDDASTTVQVNGTFKVTGAATIGGIITAGAINASAISSFNLSGTALSIVTGQVLGLAAADGTATTVTSDARAAAPQFIFRRANGTSTSMTALASGDAIGAIQFRGHDGSALTTTRATIEATAAETWSGSGNGANILFKTTAVGATTAATTRMMLAASGALLIAGTTDDGTNKLRVTGGVTVDTGNSYKVNNVAVLGARKTGWTVATGTATRTTFDTATVTLADLAQRVKALIDDLHNTAGHGLIGT